MQSSIFSLRAVCIGNNSITLSKAELQAGIISSCFTILHNQGPVLCIWSASPRSETQLSDSVPEPPDSCSWHSTGVTGKDKLHAALQPVNVCACRHICTLQGFVLVEPYHQKSCFSAVCHGCTSVSLSHTSLWSFSARYP